MADEVSYVAVDLTLIRDSVARRYNVEALVGVSVEDFFRAAAEYGGFRTEISGCMDRPHVIAIDGIPFFDSEAIPEDIETMVIKIG